MERLTTKECGELLIKYSNGEYRSPCLDCENINKCNPEKVTCGFYKALKKLEEYETLEERCVKENSLCLRMLLHKWKEFIEDIKELYECRELEEQGKLLKLPCAVGDTVYSLNTLPSGRVVIGETTADAYICALGMIEGRIGKTMFLTVEEAEAALKEL